MTTSGGASAPIGPLAHWFVGETRVFQHTVKDASGNALDISNWAFEVVMRQDPRSATALLTLTNGHGIVITNAAAGTLQWTVTAAQSRTLGLGNLYYTLARTDAGFEAVLAFGEAVVAQSAIR